MRKLTGPSATVLLLALTGCSSPSADPAALAADLPPARAVSPQEQAESAALAAEAMAAVDAEDAEAAESLAERALQRAPRSGRARAALGLALMLRARRSDPPDLGLWHRAEGELRRAVALDPRDPEVGVAYARFLEAEGHWSAAIQELEGALAAQPEHRVALRRLARLRYDAGDERAASAVLVRLLALEPGDAEASYRLAQCRLTVAGTQPREEDQIAGFTAAAAAFAAYQRLAPADADGYLGEAHARLQRAALRAGTGREEYEAVRRLYRLAAELRPGAAEAWFGAGLAAERLGQMDDAHAAWREALQRDPMHVGAILALAGSLQEAGRRDAALPLWQRALGMDLDGGERRRIQALLRAAGAQGGDR